MTSRDDERLWGEALALLLRLRERPGDPALRDEAARWCAQSSAHRAAFDEAEAVWRVTGALPRTQAPTIAPPRAPLLTRRHVAAGLGFAVAAGIAGLAVPELTLRARADVLTGTAEIRRVALPDGSAATLGPDSAVRLAYGPDAREVDLLAGMAYFEVAAGSAAPFRAVCGPLAVTAAGTAFEVSRDAGWLIAAADKGSIAVRLPATSGPAESMLEAGDWLSFDESEQAMARGVRAAGLRAAWRDRVAVADREPVGAVVARIARWHRGRVLVAPGFGGRRVSGIFDLRDPRRALEAVVAPFHGHVRDLSPWLTVLTTI
ncbi:MAG: FecR domain-containing protein [Rhodoplanes sp.]|uniref:FecR family protein n=1 Tax=Rhodoplanes sp. TaxID=1968906 RepID=UPI00184D2395|nr:FecR domain-containing protein [Rhodoplanes sp.]NVO13942.1 FecR domain-containing protein [Rhodoplanes sp.]